MTRTEFINGLDFEVAKNTIAKKLGMKADNLSIKPYKSGNFKIDLKNASGAVGSLIKGARRAVITTEDLNIKESNDEFSYKANVNLTLRNNSGEYVSKLGKIDFEKNKFIFSTMNDIKKIRAKRSANTTGAQA